MPDLDPTLYDSDSDEETLFDEADFSEDHDSEPEGTQDQEYIKRLKAQIKGSSAEALRRKEEAEELRARLLAMESARQYAPQQQQQQSAPTEQKVQQFLTVEENSKLSEAYINDDAEVASEILNRGFQRMQQSIGNQLGSYLQQQQYQQQLNQRVEAFYNTYPDLKDPNSALAKSFQKHYQQIVNDPQEMFGFESAVIDMGNGQRINTGAVRMAIERAKRETPSKGARNAQRAGAEHFIEGSSSSSSPNEASNRFDPKVHLTRDEIKAVNAIKRTTDPEYTYKKFWDQLEKWQPGTHRQRLESGKAENLSANQQIISPLV